jgi:hypothetical protein
MILKPFFSYYGGKWRIAPRYPAPLHNTIIEPFAGSAGYSVRHYTNTVRLYDADPIIAGVWDYLIKATPDEIRQLPVNITNTDILTCPQEAKWLIGFWLGKGRQSPGKTPSQWMRTKAAGFWGTVIRERIASQCRYIKHWVVKHASYADIENSNATWFIDPPYNNTAGKVYRHNVLDYSLLAGYCRARNGQVIVCENKGAEWLPFTNFTAARATYGKVRSGVSEEVIYTQAA